MKKGVSDIIAVVLMIAVAIAIGVFVTNFATQWVQEQVVDDSITCAIQTNYVVDDAKFNFSSKDELLVTITNKGDQSLYGFGFVLNNITDILTFTSSDSLITNQVAPASPLEREQSVILTLNLSTCNNESSLYCNTSSGYPVMGKTATSIRITNDACSAVSAAITSVTVY